MVLIIPECHGYREGESNPWCRAWKPHGFNIACLGNSSFLITIASFPNVTFVQKSNWQVSHQRVKTYLMRNWTSAESVSISLLLASSPMVIFTPSLTKSLSWKCVTLGKTPHVLKARSGVWISLSTHTFNVGSFFCFSFSLASLSTVDPFKSYFLCTWCKTIVKVHLLRVFTFRWPLKTFLITHM